MREPKNDANPGRRVLVLGARMLTPDIDTGSLRIYHLLRMARELSWRATFLPSFPYSWPPYTARLEEDTKRLVDSGIEVPAPEEFPSADEFLEKEGKSYHMVILGEEYAAFKHIDSVRRYAAGAKIIFDTGEIHYRRHYHEAKVTGNVRALRRALQSKKRELAAAREADCTLVVSPIEKSILERDCPGIRTHVIPSVHEIHGCARFFAERKDILFIGSFQHSPNPDAVRYFVDRIFPLIKAAEPGLRFHVVGAEPPSFIESLRREDILVAGHVPDLASVFDHCRLSVAPLRFGGGVKGKVLTSMSYGVPVAATSVAAEGMYLEDGVNVLIADEPNDFCKAVLRLYRDEDLWNRLSQNGLDIVSRHFSYPAVREKFIELLEELESE